jgi:hypothetical protein
VNRIALEMLIAIISTLISSVALAGVALSLLLQARQLRTNQIQVARTAHLELIKMTLSDPSMAAETLAIEDSEAYAKEVYLNWNLHYFWLSYGINQLSEPVLRNNARELFRAEFPRKWWSWSSKDWELATSRRDREFFTIVDSEFQRAKQIAESTGTGNAPPA